MTRTDRPTRIAGRMAALLVILILGGLYSNAADPTPITLTKNSVLKGTPVSIGDLSVEGELTAGASRELSRLERCIQEGPEWLSWSEDGMTLEIASPWGSTLVDTVLTTYCDQGIILIGGDTWTGPSVQRAWLFAMVSGRQSSPVKITFTKAHAVESGPRETQYSLNELRSIDLDSSRILFSGTSENGQRALLSAPIAIARE